MEGANLTVSSCRSVVLCKTLVQASSCATMNYQTHCFARIGSQTCDKSSFAVSSLYHPLCTYKLHSSSLIRWENFEPHLTSGGVLPRQTSLCMTGWKINWHLVPPLSDFYSLTVSLFPLFKSFSPLTGLDFGQIESLSMQIEGGRELDSGNVIVM